MDLLPQELIRDPYNILITLCVLVIISYVFTLLASKVRIPLVIFLLGTGVIIHYTGNYFNIHLEETRIFLELFGIIGLILIVLEGSLDLTLSRKKLPLIGKSFASALFILLSTSAIISLIFIYGLKMETRISFIYAIPLAVISSAIAIPSVHRLSTHKKEFIVYESTFSDVLGIMIFNYAVVDNFLSADSILIFFTNFVSILVISGIGSIVLIYLLNHVRTQVKSFLVFAILMLIYSISKLFHLPSLLLILIFGLMLNNPQLFIKGPLGRYLDMAKVESVNRELKTITAESAFLIRTFFFILFGYSMNLSTLVDTQVVITGMLIIFTILVTRALFLLFISKTHLFPELFIAPRGLITIILFYSIPLQFHSPLFNEGILSFVIILSSLIMMFGLIITKSSFDEKENKLIDQKHQFPESQ